MGEGKRKAAGDLKRKTQLETLRSVFGGVKAPFGRASRRTSPSKEESHEIRLATHSCIMVANGRIERRPQTRTPALHLNACVNLMFLSDDLGNFTSKSVPDDRLDSARDNMVSENALLGIS